MSFGQRAADGRDTTVEGLVAVVTPAVLEVFAQGLLVHRSMLDEFLMYVPDPPSAADAAVAAR